MKRFLLLLSLLGCLTLSHPATASEARPNVLLILVDDLKPSFGAYGADWVHSPNLDRLAESGMRFDMAYCNQAVCAPSRNNLLTSSRSTSTGVYSLGRNFRKAVPDAVTLPQFFKQHGYHTAGVGKVFHIGHGNVGDPVSWSVPFQSDKVIDYVLPESTDGKLTREEALFSNKPARGLPRGAAWEKADVDDDAYADGRIAAEGIKRLREYSKSGEAFFLTLGFVKPHLPFCAPTKYWNLYDPAKLPMPTHPSPPTDAPAYAGKTIGELNQYKPVPQDPPLKPEMIRTLIHGYYAALSYMDAQLGRVLDELDRLGLEKNTIVVLWGDHGYHLGDHSMWTKHTNYEQANRIPILIRAPGVTKPGSHSKALIESVDIYPTLAELAGLSQPTGPQSIDGASLVHVLKDPTATIRDHAYHCFPRGNRLGRAVRTSRYRLVEWRGIDAPAEIAEYELYDYQDDPLETKNLAQEKPKVLKELIETLRQHPEPQRADAVQMRKKKADPQPEAFKSHHQAIHITDGWIRDPYIVLGADGFYYLTGTTPLPDDPREARDPFNTGLGNESIVGWKMAAWRSKDLIDWEYLGTPYTLKDGIWHRERPQRFKQVDEKQWRLWAPELHDVGGRWAIVHTSPSPVRGANLSLTKGPTLEGPFTNPMGAAIKTRHDPSLFKDDDGTWWMIWGATQVAPLKPDFTGFAAEPTTIGPSGDTAKMGHEGCLMRKIGGKYVLFGTGWSTGSMRKGSYNLYYATADKITGPYSERKFAGRFLGHGTPFQDKQGRWWCTAFYNGNVPPLSREQARGKDLGETAQTINKQGVTLVPLDVRVTDAGEVVIRAKDPDYATPGPDEAQQFEINNP